MDSAYKEDEHTYDYIDSSAFSNYAYEGHTSIQKNREVFQPTPPKRSSLSISRQNRCLFVSVIVGVLIVIITVVVVIVVKKKNESKPQTPMEFEATMTLVTPWQPEYSDPDSEVYQRFTSTLLAQTEDGIRESEVGMDLDFIVISNLSPGSVICDIKIFMKTAKYSVNGASRDVTPIVILSTITEIVRKAKQDNPASLLAKVDTAEISVRQPQTGAHSGTESTRSPPQTSMTAIRSSSTTKTTTTTTTTSSITTSVFRRTSSSVSSSPSTSTDITPDMIPGNDSPCRNITYLETVLFMSCYDDDAYNRAFQSNDLTTALCRFLDKTIRCIVQEVAKDTGITCSRAQQNQFIEQNADNIQILLVIDPRMCLSSSPFPSFETSTSTAYPEPDMTTSAIITNRSPCENSSYLEQLLLTKCVDYSRYVQVSQSDSTVKCSFVGDAIACVIKNVYNETGVRCTKNQRDAVIKQNADLVQRLLSIDISTCFPM
ncbi:uncharacterized protein LOC134229799 [Saccostrea cucullata]|uniref:uncharacterized protein LOC134229799 n=1 Tax=Saccostrea cuccullata TaxID=36930 RepID=UPI002ED63B4C